MADFKVLLDGLMFTEGPRWHDGKLFFSDMHAHKVMSVDLDGKGADRRRSARRGPRDLAGCPTAAC